MFLYYLQLSVKAAHTHFWVPTYQVVIIHIKLWCCKVVTPTTLDNYYIRKHWCSCSFLNNRVNELNQWHAKLPTWLCHLTWLPPVKLQCLCFSACQAAPFVNARLTILVEAFESCACLPSLAHLYEIFSVSGPQQCCQHLHLTMAD